MNIVKYLLPISTIIIFLALIGSNISQANNISDSDAEIQVTGQQLAVQEAAWEASQKIVDALTRVGPYKERTRRLGTVGELIAVILLVFLVSGCITGKPASTRPDTNAWPDTIVQPKDAGPDQRKPDGPQSDGTKPDGPQMDGLQTDGPQGDGPQIDGSQKDGPPADAPQTDAPKTDSFKTDSFKTDGPQGDSSQSDTLPGDGTVTDTTTPDASPPQSVTYSSAHAPSQLDYTSTNTANVKSGTVSSNSGGYTITTTATDPNGTGGRVYASNNFPDKSTTGLEGGWDMEGTTGTSPTSFPSKTSSSTNPLNNYKGTLVTGPGNKGTAIKFSSKGYLYVPEGTLDAELSNIKGGACSIAVSLKVDSSAQKGEFDIQIGRLSKGEQDVRLVIDTSTMQIKATDSKNGSVTIVGTVPYGKYFLVVMERDSSGNYKFYINNKDSTGSKYTLKVSNPTTKTPGLYINTKQLTGVTIDNLLIYNRTLSATERQKLYYDTGNLAYNLDGTARKYDFNYTATGAFFRRYHMQTGKYVDIPVKASSTPIGATTNLATTKTSSFDPSKIVWVDTLSTKPNTIVIWGDKGNPSINRGEFAGDSKKDPDASDEDWQTITTNLDSIKGTETLSADFHSQHEKVVYVTAWDGFLMDNGMGFNINGNVYSAFTVRETGTIYLPHPAITYNHSDLRIEGDLIKGLIQERMDIVLNHEACERDGGTHEDAIAAEPKTAGINRCDIITVLLQTILTHRTQKIDLEFVLQVHGNLLTYLQRYDESANLKGPQLINIFKGLGLEIERIELRFQPQTLTFQTSV